MSKLEVYNACFGPRSNLLDPPKDLGVFLKTYSDSSRDLKHWAQIFIELPDYNPTHRPDTPKLRARYIKAHSTLFTDSEYSLWIDGSMQLIKNPEPDLDELLGECDLAGYKHPRRNCAYEELATCKGERKEVNPRTPRDHRKFLSKAQERLKNNGFPENYGLIENGFLLRRNTDAIKKMEFCWWNAIEQTTTEDQPMMMYALWFTNTKWKFIEPGKATENPYIKWIGHNSNIRT